MSKLTDDFKEIRKVSTPWTAIRTTDYLSTIRTLLKVRHNGEEGPPPAAVWTCVDGVQSPVCSPTGEKLSEGIGVDIGDSDCPLFVMLKNAKENLPPDAILFMVTTDNILFDNPFTLQAISNVRDVFKTDRRTLVILGVDPKLPPFLAEDVPVLEDPLPDEDELTEAFCLLLEAQNITFPQKECEKAASCCLGMTRFAAEEALARKLRKKGIDYAGLSKSQQEVVEQSSEKALRFEKETWTFDQIGGLGSFKSFMESLFNGPKKPHIVVRVDEIDKSITAASSGQVADNTGVSQDILKTLLTSLEDNKWMGLLACGGPGTGKTLASICTGNQFGVKTLSLDLGAVKGSLVGASEQKIRRVVDILKTIGGENVLFIATANRLDTLPPELQRRFWLGTWFWDLPTAEEKERIWQIQTERYGVKEDVKYRPKDESWTGSDVRNCITPNCKVLRDDLRWVNAGDCKIGETILGFDEEGPWRKYRPAVIEEVVHTKEPVMQVILENGHRFCATEYHTVLRWPKRNNGGSLTWKKISELNRGDYLPKLLNVWKEDESKDAGWLAGMFDGEGCLYLGGQDRKCPSLGVAQNPGSTHDKLELMLLRRGESFTESSAYGTTGKWPCRKFTITGGLPRVLQFLGEVRPERLIPKLSFGEFGRVQSFENHRVVCVDSIGVRDIVKIQTSTGTLVVDGYPHHNCCQMAWVCGCSLADAAERITIAGITSRTQTEALRDTAEKLGFRSAATPGAYKRPEKRNVRRIGV